MLIQLLVALIIGFWIGVYCGIKDGESSGFVDCTNTSKTMIILTVGTAVVLVIRGLFNL